MNFKVFFHTCKNKSICSSTLNKKCNLKVVPNLICHLYPWISFTMEPRSKRGLVILISVLAVILILILIITVLLRDQNVVQETEVFTRPQMQDSKVEIMRMYPTNTSNVHRHTCIFCIQIPSLSIALPDYHCAYQTKYVHVPYHEPYGEV